MRADIACPIRLKKTYSGDVQKGFPWVYAQDIIESSEAMLVPPGSLVSIENHKGQYLATGFYNPASTIAARVLSRSKEVIDVAFFTSKIEQALKRREKAFTAPFYRLLHAESDGLPGLLLDRFAGHLVFQCGAAGMERLQSLWIQSVEQLFTPSSLLLRNDIAVRQREGLPQEVVLLKGDIPELVEVVENDIRYLADLKNGQKTGWFFDQRDNRKMIAELAPGKTLVDVYSHSGGFGLLAAHAGASHVTLVDSSKLALELAEQAAKLNGLSGLDYQQGDAIAVMQRLFDEGKRFDIVLADPPAFVKQKKDVASGMKGYEKVARHAARLVAPGGLLFVASCSHHATRPKFNQAVLKGAKADGRGFTTVTQTGAGADHPIHPLLPQSEYLKGILLRAIA